MEPVRVGIIGLGRSGWDIHAKTLAERSDFQVVAAADLNPERGEEARRRFDCAAYTEYRELLADPRVELVVNAALSHLHAPIAIETLRAGKDVLVEKPFATTVEEADAMIATARETGRRLIGFQNRRTDADFIQIQRVIQSGVLGEVFQVRIGRYNYARRRDWQTLRKYGGGMLNNWGAHMVDQALTLLGGEYVDLLAQLRNVASAGDAEDHFKLTFRNSAGMVADVEMGVCALPQPEWLVMGTHGTLSGSTRELRWKFYDPAAVPKLTVLEESPADRAYGTGEVLPWQEETWKPEGERSPNHLYYDRLYAALREGAPMPVPPEQSRLLIQAMAEARAQNGISS